MVAALLGQPGPGDAAKADGADEGLRGGVLQHWLLPPEPAEASWGQRTPVPSGSGTVPVIIFSRVLKLRACELTLGDPGRVS